MEHGQSHGDPTRSQGIALSRIWPEVDGVVPAGDRELAARVLVVPVLTVHDEPLSEHLAAKAPTAFDFLVADGLVFKETVFAARSALELLGPGDVLAPLLTAARQLDERAVSRYTAHGRAAIAVLDHRFREAARRWPGLSDVMHDRLGRQTHRASMHLAMLHQPRAEDRIVSLFVDLADRFGRMTADGAVVGLGLTHELIGRLVGAQRPTVSIALGVLAASGTLVRLDDGGWRVAPDAMAP